MNKALQEIKKAFSECDSLEDKINLLNSIKDLLHSLSPFAEEPVDCVRWIQFDQIQANEYNPNRVASVELKLLYESIKSDGYTQPIVAYKLDNGKYEIVDGYHRNRVGREFSDIKERINGYLPLVVLDKALDERIGSTIRHNRARGTHIIRSMSDIVIDLVKTGWDDDKICQKLGMDKEEVLRLKQISGLRQAFLNHEFSKSWEEIEYKNFPNEIGVIAKTVSNKPVKRPK